MITYQPAKPSTPTAIETDPVKRMADIMLEIDSGGHTVDREAISLMGFSSADIDKYSVEAREVANARSQKQAA